MSTVPPTPEPVPDCPRLPEAGAYLLGALSPAERADYSRHVAQCPFCVNEVGQLAGLPGLLARGPAAAAADPQAPVAPAPDPHGAGSDGAGPDGAGPQPAEPARSGAVSAALDEIYRARRHRRALVAGGFVLVAALGAVGSTLVTAKASQPTAVVAAAELPVQMQPVGDPPVSAAMSLTERPWGTEVVMRCRYAGAPQSPVYVLVARSADGVTSELARWSGVTDQDLVLASATELVGDKLAELEVRNAAGKVLLRADRPS